MTTHSNRNGSEVQARLLVGVAAVAMSVLTACGDHSRHATDGDTGAAAPAAVRDMSATPMVGDSTPGVAKATGQPQTSGDTMGARGKDPKPGPTGGKPAGRP
jgi:hypothetical protein